MKHSSIKTISAIALVASLGFNVRAQVNCYCSFNVDVQFSWGAGITNVKLNSNPAINRTSAATEGLVNSNLTGTVNKGQSYNFSCTKNANTWGCMAYNIRVYIDFNGDCDFDDAGETVFSKDNASTSGTETGTINIPLTAATGQVRMRVALKMASGCGHPAVSPCDIPPDPYKWHGEVEDYTLDIQNVSGISENILSMITTGIFPNPFTANTSISYTLTEKSQVSLEIYNIVGKKITTLIKDEMQASGDHVYNLDNEKVLLNEGMYFIKFIVGDKSGTQKLIKLNR